MPQSIRANEAQFYFFCGALAADTFEVINFEGRDSISRPYSFRITLASSNDSIAFADVVCKQASLYLWRDGEFVPYSGVVADFTFMGKNYDHATYVLTLTPKIHLLGLNKQTRIFQKKSIPAIIKDVLDGSSLSNYYQMQLDNSKYSELDFVVQYQESDLNFISRLMETHGIWYFFNEAPVAANQVNGAIGSESMIIADRVSSFTDIATTSSILYRSVTGLTEQINETDKESISSFNSSRQLIPKNVVVKDYNEQTPEVDLTGQKPVSQGDAGTVYEFGGHFKDVAGAQRSAEIISGRLATRQCTCSGVGVGRGFRAGKRFILQEHFKNDLNGTYLITQVHHTGAHPMNGERQSTSTYANRFVCLPSAAINLFRPEARTPIPRVPGIFTAVVESNGSSYAGIDDQGRYKVRMPFDASSTANMQASKALRLAQPYAGKNAGGDTFGMHFPVYEKSEMIIACYDGNPDRPMGIGTVPNPNTMSPVVAGNKQQNMIKTAGGNEFTMDDTDTKQKIRFKTKAANMAEFDDENKCLYVKTTAENKLLLDDQNKKVVLNADAHTLAMEYGSSKAVTITTGGGAVIKIDDTGKKITIQGINKNLIELDDSAKKITFKDGSNKNTVQLDGSKGLILESTGKISISATQDLEIKAANIKMSTTSGKIDIKATSDLSMQGMKISAKANTDVKLEGLNISAKGSISTKVDGGTGKIECGVTGFKASGPMAEVSGSGMTTIKGGVVMIN